MQNVFSGNLEQVSEPWQSLHWTADLAFGSVKPDIPFVDMSIDTDGAQNASFLEGTKLDKSTVLP